MLAASAVLALLILLLIRYGAGVWSHFMGWPFGGRALVACSLLAPLGLCLGLFFPSGLQAIEEFPDTIAWAWGINCGFTVLGSLIAIVLAQFYGFNAVLGSAAVCYFAASWVFKRLC